ncbi:SET domain-containing protein 8 [Erysiphe neolycopersici]|uniref:SET domain-containing protein 8 n=1 Tax=Erysiphe neolycopersici TaxID=212602 RepID=A0A420I1L9_9PEZI|nr:SET domain-containing protein 8 [Erysiphe neolycopersici]
MNRQILPISALPAWAKLNNVAFKGAKVDYLGHSKCFGLIAENALVSKYADNVATLVVVPADIILSVKLVEEYAKLNYRFRELLGKAGGRSRREDIMLYLLMQLSIGPQSNEERKFGLSSPWTDYVAMLPAEIPVPTMWSSKQLRMLKGTSLEAALNAKLDTLKQEFDYLYEATKEILWCENYWWKSGKLKLHVWILLDAWFRSRSLELPVFGEAMVPCIDMVNHSKNSNSYYESTSENGVCLLLKPQEELEPNTEITINYGETKSNAEMLYSYGFIDQESQILSLTLSLHPLDDDPLSKAKFAAYPGSPILRIYFEDKYVKWNSPFIYFMCLNEEDGLEFKVLQQNDGNQILQVFWQDLDVSDKTDHFESLIIGHPLHKIFELRVITILCQRVEQQLEQIQQSDKIIEEMKIDGVASERKSYAMQLRKSERYILENFLESLGTQKDTLLASDIIKEYLSANTCTEELDNSGYESENDFS